MRGYPPSTVLAVTSSLAGTGRNSIHLRLCGLVFNDSIDSIMVGHLILISGQRAVAHRLLAVAAKLQIISLIQTFSQSIVNLCYV